MTPPGPAWLFCPGDRPDRYRNALAAADLVIIDLEDAVGADQKGAARRAMVTESLEPERVVVRVGGAGEPGRDPRALGRCGRAARHELSDCHARQGRTRRAA